MGLLHQLFRCLVVLSGHGLLSLSRVVVPKGWVRFLIAVNDTWAEPPGCIATVATEPLKVGAKYNTSSSIRVGNCDHGPLVFTATRLDKNQLELDLTFHSSVIEDASPPTCNIKWTGSYLVPPADFKGPLDTLPSLLPGCFTMESREGYHMTYYWFYLLDWSLEI